MNLKNLVYRILRLFKRLNYTIAHVIDLSPNDLLKNKTALITGGTSGIGFAIAKAFLKSGATVIITGRSVDRIEKSIKELSDSRNEIYGIVLDNTDISSFEGKLNDILSMLNGRKLDILVNNAGINNPHSIKDVIEKEYDDIMNTNLKGTYFLSQIVGRYMRDNKVHGHILNIASSSSLRPAVAPYALSKWGLRGLTLGLAKAFIPYNIIVNGLAPGPTATPMMMNDASHIEHPNLPLGRYIMPEEIANMAVVLCSDMSCAVVGDIVYMTGGAGLVSLEGDNYNF